MNALLDCHHPNKSIEERLEAIYSLHTKKMDFRLDKGPYRDLLNNLGNPHLNLPPTIHVAGTNGKGSVIAFLKSLLESQGLSVHTYTSPHLIKFNERIVLVGEEISDETLLHYIDIIDRTNNGAPLTFFEYTTALAFKAFADTSADICLLETGLGGRLDCTNVIEKPLATVITSIGHDHMDWLGHDINDIAREKAGIMKADAPCFVAPQQYDVHKVFEEKAETVGCDVHFIERMDNLPKLGLVGDHQEDNASTALTTLSVIAREQRDRGNPYNIDMEWIASSASPSRNDKIANALKNTKWRARMEKLSDTPEIWFDCGHNREGAETIATQLKTWKQTNPDRPIHLVVGLAADKDPNEFLKPLSPYIDALICVDLPNARTPQTGEELKARIRNTPISIKTASPLNNVPFSKDALTLITGSLYLYEQTQSL